MQFTQKHEKLWIPLITFIVIASLSFYFANVLKNREISNLHNLIGEKINKVEQLIIVRANDRFASLTHMAHRWEVAKGTSYDIWKSDVDNFLNDQAGLKAVEWVDASYHIQWVEPRQGNENVIGMDIRRDEERVTALKNAEKRNTVTLTPPLDLVQGYKGLLVYVPVYIDDKFNGYIVGVFSADDFLKDTINAELAYRYVFDISQNGKSFFHLEPENATPVDKYSNTGNFQVSNQPWELKVTPTQKYLDDRLTSLPQVIFWGGLILAFLVSLCGYIAFRWRYSAIVLLQAEKLLHEEQRRLTDVVNTQNEVAHSHSDLQFAMNLIVERTQNITDADGSVIEMLDEKDMVYSAVSGCAGPFMGLRLHAADSLSGLCLRENKALKCDDTETDARVNKDVCRKIGAASMVVVPLIRQKRSVGVLKVMSSRPHAFNDQHVASLSLLAGVLSAALSDAMVYDILRKSEETFRSAMQHASIGMALVSPEGRWLKVNEAFCKMIGYSEAELLKTNFQNITHPDDLGADLNYLHQMLKGEIQTYQLEKRYIHKDGHTIWSLLSVSLVRDATGNPDYFISQIQDITERKEIDRIKAEFISIVSHELRTPLTSIRGSLGLIAGVLSKDLPEKVRHLVDIAHKNSERLILLINDILDIDKMAAGQMRFDIKRESVRDLISQAIETNKPYAEKLGIEILMDAIPSPAMIDVDGARFMQVMSNLMSNAAKFSPKNGTVKVYATSAAGKIRIYVRDSGPGIAEEFRSRIFGKFSQADSSTTREKGGTGLGLHITKEIVEHMGGKIGFDTESGKGTTFWVEFADASPLPVPVETGRMDKDTHRILICEDDANIADILRMQIETAGFSADIVHSIAEARRKIGERNYAAMTLDLAFQEENGLEFIHELRTNSKTVHLPIVVVSAKAEEGRKILNGDAFGIVDWLKKPLDEKQLIDALSRATSTKRIMPRILHVEDDHDISEMLATALQSNAELVNASTIYEAKTLLAKDGFSLVVLDLGMPDGNGLSLLPYINERNEVTTPVIILSAQETAVDLQANVVSHMVKSRMSETKVVETILSLIQPNLDSAGDLKEVRT